MRRKKGANCFAVLIGLVLVLFCVTPTTELDETDQHSTVNGSGLLGDPYNPTDSSLDALWQKYYGGTDHDGAFDIIKCENGGFAIAGYGTNGMGGGIDGWLARCDEFGNVIWNHTYGGVNEDRFHSLFECSNGDFVLAGTSASYAADWKAWLVRTDSSGSLLWEYVYGGLYTDSAASVVECTDGRIAVTGYTTQTDKDLWVFMTYSNGLLNWSITQPLLYDQEGLCMIQDSSDDLVVVGYHASGSGLSTRDGWLLIIDPDQTIHHSSFRERTTSDERNEFWSVVELSGGGYAMTGVCIFPGLAQQVWFYSVDSNLAEFRNQDYGGSSVDYGVSLYQCEDGDFIILCNTLSYGAGGQDALLLRTDGLSQYWLRTYGGSSDDSGTSVVEYCDGSIAFVGYTLSFGAGAEDAWFARVQPVQWIELPSDQIMEDGYPLNYTMLIRTSAGSISIPLSSVNNSYFSLVDSSGNVSLTNSTPTIPLGSYGLCITLVNIYGDFINTTITVVVEPAMAPSWVEEPDDQFSEYGDEFVYSLLAVDTAGIETWWVNDTTWFSISADGVLTNSTPLPIADYPLQVRVTDLLGNTSISNFTVFVADTTPPIWIVEPEDQFLNYGTLLNYTIGAWDISGIDHWWLNDTNHFSLDEQGVIRNSTVLEPGVYGLEVRAYDPFDNYCSAALVLTVNDATTIPTTTTTQPQEGMDPVVTFFLGIGICGAAVVVIVIVLLRRRS